MDLVIIGAGGFGREVLDVARAVDLHGSSGGLEVNVLGFIDDGEVDHDRLRRIGSALLGDSAALSRYGGAHFVVAVGDPRVRERLVQVALDAGLVVAPPLEHPESTVGSDVTIGDGSIICAGVRVNSSARIGDHVHLNPNVNVGHDAVLEDYVSVNPLVAVSGNVIVQRGALVGTTASINQGLTVHAGSTVGSGAAVIRDVPPRATVVGVPAREVGSVIKSG